jgi:hypothetical protein
MAHAANQSRTCPNCEVKISLNEAKVLAKCKTSQRALELIQNIKQKENKSSYMVTYKKFKT